MATFLKPGVHLRETDSSLRASTDPDVLEMSKTLIGKLFNPHFDVSKVRRPVYDNGKWMFYFCDNALFVFSYNNSAPRVREVFEYSNPNRFNVETIREYINRDPA